MTLYQAIREAVEAEVRLSLHASHAGLVARDKAWESVRQQVETLERKVDNATDPHRRTE